MKDNDYINKISSSYQSLGPTENALNYELFDKILTDKLGEKYHNGSYKNKNIAITGIYGAGKSSMIKTFLSNHDIEDKCITVGLGKYSNKNKSDKKIESDIENSLLQQIIYNARPNDLMFSRINRSDVDVKKNNIYAMVIAFILMIIVVIFKYNSFISIINSDNIGSNAFSNLIPIRMFIFLCLFSFVLYFFFFFILKKIKLYGYIKKFIIKGNGVELDENTTSILNKSLDELIHFFMMTNYDIVVFEDVDRLNNCVEIFTKLKEINFVINNSLKDKSIRFIYEINDSIFDSRENRTKFFDVIIPVVSYTAPLVSDTLLIKLFSKLFEKELNDIIDKKDFIYISSFIDNSRVAYDIYNEFSIYYHSNIEYLDNEKIRNLFYLVSYKVLFPVRFDNFLKNKGSLSYMVSEDYKKDFVDFYKSKKNKEYDSRIEKLDEKIKEKNNKMQIELLDTIKSKQNYSNFVYYDDNENILFNQNYMTNDNIEQLIYVLYNNIITIREGENIIQEDYIYPNNSKYEFFEKYFNSNDDNEKKEISNQKMKLNEISYYDITDKQLKKEFEKLFFMNESYSKYEYSNGKKISNNLFYGQDKEKLLNTFEEYLIDNNFIDNYSTLFFTVQNGKFEEIKDKFLLNELIKDVIYDVNTKINNPKEFITYFQKDLIKKDSFCLFDIYKEVKNDSEYINIIFDNLSELKLKNIMKMDKINNLLLSNNFNKIWEFIEKNRIDADVVNYYVIKTIELGKPSEMKSDYFFDYVNNKNDIDNLFETFFLSIKNNYINYNFNLKQNNFNKNNIKFMNFLYDNRIFNSNISLFNTIILSKGKKLNESKLFESYFNCNDDIVDKYVKDNVICIIDYIEKIEIIQKDQSQVVKKVIKLLDDNYEYVKKILLKEEKKISKIDKLENYYIILDSFNKYQINLINLNKFFQYYKKNNIEPISGEMKNNINNNYSLIFNQPYRNKYKEFIQYIILETDINISAFEFISNYYFKNNDPTIDNSFPIPQANYEYLIRSGNIYGNIDQVKEKYLDGNCSEDIAKKYFKNSILFLDFDKETNMIINTKMLNDIFDFDNIDYKKKMDIILKYNELFNEQTYENIFNIILNDNYEMLNKEIIMKCLSIHKITKDIVACIIKYKDKIDFYLDEICDVLSKDNEFKKLLNSKRKSESLSLSVYSLEFINFLCSISEGKYSINGYTYNNNKMSINIQR